MAFEQDYFEAAAQYFSHYATGTPSVYVFVKIPFHCLENCAIACIQQLFSFLFIQPFSFIFLFFQSFSVCISFTIVHTRYFKKSFSFLLLLIFCIFYPSNRLTCGPLWLMLLLYLTVVLHPFVVWTSGLLFVLVKAFPCVLSPFLHQTR